MLNWKLERESIKIKSFLFKMKTSIKMTEMLKIFYIVFMLSLIITIISIILSCKNSEDSSLQNCFGLNKIINDSVNDLFNYSTNLVEDKLGVPINEIPNKINVIVQQLKTLNNSTLMDINDQLYNANNQLNEISYQLYYGNNELSEIRGELSGIHQELGAMNNKLDSMSRF